MKHLKPIFENVEWESLPQETIDHAKRLIELHFSAVIKDKNDKFKLELGLEKLCRDIVKSVIDDYIEDPTKFKK